MSGSMIGNDAVQFKFSVQDVVSVFPHDAVRRLCRREDHAGAPDDAAVRVSGSAVPDGKPADARLPVC